MKTVLFINKEERGLWSSFLKYDFFLNEFQDKGHFSVCAWNPAATNVSEAIPDFADALGETSEWQAVIVTDLRSSQEALKEDIHFENPFDFADRYEVEPGEEFSESSHGLVRLTQMLGGLPEKTYVSWPEFGEDEAEHLSGWSIDEQITDEHYDIVERYRLGLPRPQRIICITPRDIDESFYDVKERSLRQMNPEKPVLDFWQRNDYPSSARFVVIDHNALPAGCDLLSFDNESAQELSHAYKTKGYWFSFWMSVLTLMEAPALASRLRAYSVYRLHIDLDPDELSYVLSRRRIEWHTAEEMVHEYCVKDTGRLKTSEYVMADMPHCEVTIPVSFDLVEADNLLADSDSIEFYKDSPVRDLTVWSEQRRRILHEFRELLRAPRRAVLNAASRFRSTEPLTTEELEYCILNEYEKVRLEEDLRIQECDLASMVGASKFNFGIYQSNFMKNDKEVRKKISERATQPQALGALGIGFAMLAIGLVPYCLSLLGGPTRLLLALGVSALACAVLVVVWALTMVSMRNDVRFVMSDFNSIIHSILDLLSKEADRLQRRISSYATFRKSWSVLNRQYHLNVPTQESIRLGCKEALLRSRIDDIDEIALSCETSAMAPCAAPAYDWEMLLRLIDDPDFYNLRSITETECVSISGEDVDDMPYRFIGSAAVTKVPLN